MKNVVIILTLLLMGTTSAYAGGNSTWTLCINGVDFRTGGYCGQPRHKWRPHQPRHDHGHGHGHGNSHKPRHDDRPGFITLRGQQAFNVIRNGYIISSRVAYDGNELYRVKYFGYGHRVRIYDCRVSPVGRAECQAWKY